MGASDGNSLAEAAQQQRCDGIICVNEVQAPNVEEDPIEELQAVFDTFDENHDGKISSEELRRSMAKLGFNLPDSELTTIMEEMDVNRNGYLEFDEFTCLYRTMQAEGKLKFSAERDQDLRDAFRVFDRDQDGFITAHELQSVFSSLGMGKAMKLADCVMMIKGVDANGDGKVSFSEFKDMMNRKGCGSRQSKILC